MKRLETRLDGPILIAPTAHGDHRGFFLETYRKDAYTELGLPADIDFVQDNHSRSRQGIVRGMHYQDPPGQHKLVRAARGTILDVVVDIRVGSPTFGEHELFELSDTNHHQLFVPIGFGHGFVVTSPDGADVVYKCSNYYVPDIEKGFAYDDPDVGIPWPTDIELLPSERDRTAPRLREIEDELPFRYEPSPAA